MELLTELDEVPDRGYLFTVREPDGGKEEVLLLDIDGEAVAWKNFCQHETDQRLARENGAAMRDGQIICPRHGSMFDSRTGYCDNGKAKGSTLVEVDVTTRHGQVYLTDDVEFLHEGPIDDDDDMPGSTSHLQF
jgi:nitrite reductase/ring-hydroxylating ferredoxin subunit